ncbi:MULTISPECIES: 5-formyltetrahydrofolate cyclo-ligase [Prochlorococcus]|uniref:5-formyltetrahydrofolate cyclo-ligase n=1 Tax=Prochlorococcus marinus (strain SARG / CCMP1375 / SS120) TaxID=167539 RepID=Q7VBE7_PROMA|nr:MULTISPECIES: 5-formyltetrahydrofolate cyclo-ligase [Prochlorococcus]AAQ00193.1 5-formyltetrahydrofolate cyclo-ligase [Prochlorococcus marinus subsp. marinus str. CCMP1375]KGG13993.1 5-formyltetrahydrofolate cyclo-ligase [Prochlorococcus marinus str. LG]KGG19125.1 5-formyltetrahydrofolate cyclo-ligase [Prochlorococcus marinus str. SS2]KGG23334.1 5-formyltetrahydrofolate cyclo-ligase [Prochlorococcus marinus str. SS35]KGG32430.1 5-formyltetrahydrofolate cyclo-ligase [Prochlorococcus marinus 
MEKSNDKNALRIKFKNIRKATIYKQQKLIFEQAKKLIKSFTENQVKESLIGIYWPLEDEVDLRSLRRLKGISIALPACMKKGEITYHRWTENPLSKDEYGIPAPLSQPPLSPSKLKLLLVPALAVDNNGIRLGYGEGCFDRLRLKAIWQKIPAFVVLPKACIAQSLLPKDEWDIPFNGWINEKESFHI